jgi:hypothetical protein
MQEMTNRSKRGKGVQVTSQQTPTQPTLQDMQTHNNPIAIERLLHNDS